MSFELKGEECLEVTLGRRHSKCKGPEMGDSQVCLQVFWAAGVMGSGGGWCGEASEGLGDLREEFGFPPEVPGEPWQSLEQGRDVIRWWAHQEGQAHRAAWSWGQEPRAEILPTGTWRKTSPPRPRFLVSLTV